MEVTRCERGHYYDRALGKCPVCAAEAGANIIRPELYDSTVSEEDTTSDIHKNPDNQQENNHQEEQIPELDSSEIEPLAGIMVEDTPLVDVTAEELTQRMVAGWLVCVAGPEKGKSYCLYTGTNIVGRSEKMDICIAADPAVSRENHASVSYDIREKRFYATRGETRNITYVNGKALRREVELNSRDILEFGKSMLMFIPFCGEEFDWHDSERFCQV